MDFDGIGPSGVAGVVLSLDPFQFAIPRRVGQFWEVTIVVLSFTCLGIDFS